jgi:hypothetical protein
MVDLVSLSIINLRSKSELALASQQIFLNIKPSFQREYESWDNKLKTRLVETMLIGRAMNPIWTVFNDEDDSEEVLDGMHRLTTALLFLDNHFSIGKDLMELDVDEYQGKKFNDLSVDDKNKIRNYRFTINKLDSSYKNDPQKLHDMYELLNRSSRTLNDFEFQKPLLQPFYELIQKYSNEFLNSVLFHKKESHRGQIEETIGKCIAMSECIIGNFASINDMYKKWKIKYFGQNGKITAEGVLNGLSQYESILINRLQRIKYVMSVYSDMLYQNLETKKRCTVEMMVIINRTVALIPSNDIFIRNAEKLVEEFKPLFQEEEITINRNRDFQYKLILQIDAIIMGVLDTSREPRFFSSEMINEKLKEQGMLCALCNKVITTKQKYEGDHITPWTVGGKTEKSNLQVVHARCHRTKV